MDRREHEEILYRLDERTKRVDEKLDRLEARTAENAATLDKHDDRIFENESWIETATAAGTGLGATILALLSGIGAKVFGLIKI